MTRGPVARSDLSGYGRVTVMRATVAPTIVLNGMADVLARPASACGLADAAPVHASRLSVALRTVCPSMEVTRTPGRSGPPSQGATGRRRPDENPQLVGMGA